MTKNDSRRYHLRKAIRAYQSETISMLEDLRIILAEVISVPFLITNEKTMLGDVVEYRITSPISIVDTAASPYCNYPPIDIHDEQPTQTTEQISEGITNNILSLTSSDLHVRNFPNPHSPVFSFDDKLIRVIIVNHSTYIRVIRVIIVIKSTNNDPT